MRRGLRWAAAAALLSLPEAGYRLAATPAAAPEPGIPCAVLVLGNPDPGLQERRVRAGVDAFHAAGCGLLVVSGGSPHSKEAEADRMAVLARAAGVAEPRLALERTSRTTWENVKHSLPLLEGFDRVYVVSDSLHARRGRRYWCKQAAARCAAARPASYYRFGDLYLYKWLGAAHEALAWVRDGIFY